MTVFYGWYIVGAGIVMTCVGVGAMLSLTVFLQPMSQSMGWSRTGISTAALVNWIAMGLGSFLWGMLSDRFGTRAVVLCGGALLGLGMVTASAAQTLLQFQLLFGIIVGVAAGSFYTPMVTTTSRWFTQHRSLAVALVSSGLSIGSWTVGVLARRLIDEYGWRFAMLVIGDLVWLLVIPAALLVRNPPSAAGSSSTDPAALGPDMTVGQALRSPQFAAIAVTHLACCAAHSGPLFHMVTHVIDHGIPAITAVTVLGTAGIASIGGRVVCGMLADRYGVKPTLIVWLLMQAVAVGLYLFPSSLVAFYALSVLFGVSYGGVMPLYAILVREYFGIRIMGSVFGAVAAVSTLGMAIGPWAGGFFHDAFGSYAWLFIGAAAFGLGAAAIAATFRPPAPVATVRAVG